MLTHPETLDAGLRKYNVCVAILPNINTDENEEITEKYSPWTDMLTKIANLLHPQPMAASAPVALKKAGWCQIYADSEAIILMRPGSTLCPID